MIREIVRIDEEKCNGCGLCVPACAEGAIRIIDGKAKLIADNLCDGLGACLGDCPMDAITIEHREADDFDEEAVESHLREQAGESSLPEPAPLGQGGCPSARVLTFDERQEEFDDAEEQRAPAQRSSELRQWPVQLHLVPPSAPFLRDADLLLAADCVPFAHGDFHREFLRDKALLIGCPKLDDGQAYLEKLTAMLQHNDIRSLTVLHMEVPCCSGLVAIARQALAASGKEIPLETIRIGIQGQRR